MIGVARRNAVLAGKLEEITTIKLAEEARKLAIQLRQTRQEDATDKLTGLGNKSNHAAILPALELLHNTGRLDSLVVVAMRVKNLNGTPTITGNNVIAQAGKAINKWMLNHHHASRVKGNLFYVIMPNTNIDATAARTASIKRSFEDRTRKMGKFELEVSPLVAGEQIRFTDLLRSAAARLGKRKNK